MPRLLHRFQTESTCFSNCARLATCSIEFVVHHQKDQYACLLYARPIRPPTRQHGGRKMRVRSKENLQEREPNGSFPTSSGIPTSRRHWNRSYCLCLISLLQILRFWWVSQPYSWRAFVNKLYNDLFRSIPVKPGNSTLSQGGHKSHKAWCGTSKHEVRWAQLLSQAPDQFLQPGISLFNYISSAAAAILGLAACQFQPPRRFRAHLRVWLKNWAWGFDGSSNIDQSLDKNPPTPLG